MGWFSFVFALAAGAFIAVQAGEQISELRVSRQLIGRQATHWATYRGSEGKVIVGRRGRLLGKA